MVKYVAALVLLIAAVSVGLYYDLPNIIDRVWPSVVFIRVQDEYGRIGSGSGMIVDDGLILTAGHVIEDANNVFIEFDDGVIIESSEFFIIETVDAGLIIIGTGDRLSVLFGDDVDVRVGNVIFTIGSPFGENNSVAVGVFSAHNRDIQDERLHQLDLVTNPGMSGCPVFNSYGSVIGMITRGGRGIGFMLPSETCKFVMDVYESVRETQIK